MGLDHFKLPCNTSQKHDYYWKERQSSKLPKSLIIFLSVMFTFCQPVYLDVFFYYMPNRKRGTTLIIDKRQKPIEMIHSEALLPVDFLP